MRLWEKERGADHVNLAYPRLVLAKVALDEGDFAKAREHAERAVAIRKAGEVAAGLMADTRLVLARSLWAEPSERARARRMAEQARTVMVEEDEAAGGENEALAKRSAEVERWLRRHRVR